MKSIGIVRRFAKRHSSFGVLGFSSLVFFISNIAFKEVFNNVEYGEYSIFMTYLATIYSFGFVGMDQVVLRFSKIEPENKISISAPLFITVLIIGILMSIICTVVFENYLFDFPLGLLKGLSITLSVIFSMFTFNFYRLSGKFFRAQLIGNLWKMSIGLTALLFFMQQKGSLQELIDYLFYFSLLTVCIIIIASVKLKIQFIEEKNNRLIWQFWFHFAIAIITITLLNYMDRYFIKERFGAAEFGDYFYLANIFLFPYLLLQNYTGFKKIVGFKKHLNIKFLGVELRNALLLSLLLTLCLLGGAELLSVFKLIRMDLTVRLELILLFMTLGVTRVLYTVVSSAVAAQVSLKSFRRLNLFSILILALILILSLQNIKSTENIAFVMCILWLSRGLTYFGFIGTQLRNQD